MTKKGHFGTALCCSLLSAIVAFVGWVGTLFVGTTKIVEEKFLWLFPYNKEVSTTAADLVHFGLAGLVFSVLWMIWAWEGAFDLFNSGRLRRERERAEEQERLRRERERAKEQERLRRERERITEEENTCVNTEDEARTILGVSATATQDEIKRAHRERSEEYHPDKVHSLGKKLQKVASCEMKRINQAYEFLCGKRISRGR